MSSQVLCMGFGAIAIAPNPPCTKLGGVSHSPKKCAKISFPADWQV